MGNRKASLTKIFRKSSSSSSSSKSAATASSSSSNGPTMTPLSPQPSSIEAKAAPPQATAQAQTQLTANGTAGTAPALPSKDAKPVKPSTVTTRARQGSLSDRGAAVLRALARAPEDESPEGTPSGSLTPKVPASSSLDDVASASTSEGYAPEAVAETSPRSESSTLPAAQGLTEAEKESGRANREGLRRRGESKHAQSGAQGIVRRKGSLDAGKKKSKSWEIPRKIFHSSIGECPRCSQRGGR